MTQAEGMVYFPRAEMGDHAELVNPRNSASEGLELALVRGDHDAVSEGRESLLVILGGRCAIEVEGQESWTDLGRRADVFSGPATAVFVPPGVPYRVRGAAEVAILRAPAPAGDRAYVISPEDVEVVTRGSGSFQREVHTFLDERRPAAGLIVGETFNAPGAWSSYPPHKHDVHDPPREARLQEVYHFRLQPAQGFAIQRLYSPERGVDTAYVVQDGDSVLIPFGYHPVVAAPGYRLYYLWALVGQGRRLLIHEDPAHSWLGVGGRR